MLILVTCNNHEDKDKDHKKKSIFKKMKAMRKNIFGMFKGKTTIKPKIDDHPIERQMPRRPIRGWVVAQNGQIPDRAFVAGINEEQKRFYVARVNLRNTPKGSIFSGTLIEGSTCARIAVAGFSHCYRRYQVLVGEGYIWVENKKLKINHPDSVVVDDKKRFYPCRRTTFDNIVSIGYVSNGACWYGKRGFEFKAENYEILVDMWE